MHETNQSPYRIAVALALAALAHVLILLVLSQARWQPEVRQRVPFTLIVEEEASSVTESAESRDTSESVVTSTQSESPLVFRTPDSLPERPRSLRSPSADTSWIGKLFSGGSADRSQDTDASDAEVSQMSTQDFPILSPYHLQLIQTLARTKYHDQQYSFSNLDRPRKVLLNLRLHESGALLRVTVKQSSGDTGLDAAAQRSAYAASPFPPPPASDASFNYAYPVEIQYQPRTKP